MNYHWLVDSGVQLWTSSLIIHNISRLALNNTTISTVSTHKLSEWVSSLLTAHQHNVGHTDSASLSPTLCALQIKFTYNIKIVKKLSI